MMFWIEPQYYGSFKGMANVASATFDRAMFAGLNAAVIRPGLGTMSDVLVHGGRVFAFGEGHNFEIAHNTDVLTKLDVGEGAADPVDGLRRALRFAADAPAQAAHQGSLSALEGNGIARTVEIMKGIIGS